MQLANWITQTGFLKPVNWAHWQVLWGDLYHIKGQPQKKKNVMLSPNRLPTMERSVRVGGMLILQFNQPNQNISRKFNIKISQLSSA